MNIFLYNELTKYVRIVSNLSKLSDQKYVSISEKSAVSILHFLSV